MYVFNRVQVIRQLMHEVIDGQETIPLFHVDGSVNPADMITKPRKVAMSDLAPGSLWMNGYPWMALPTENLPNKQYVSPPATDDELQMNAETFPDIECHLLQVEARQHLTTSVADECASLSSPLFCALSKGGGVRSGWLLENFDFLHLGWEVAFARLTKTCEAVFRICHRRHDVTSYPRPGCPICDNTLKTTTSLLALHTIAWTASREAEAALGNKHLSKSCKLHERVWYATQRLSKEGSLKTADLDFTPFYDGVLIKKVLPVMVVDSPLFRSLALHTHFRDLPHMGVEASIARIKQQFFPLGDARRTVAKIKNSCSKCRTILKTVVGLELADVHKARTTIAPPFYAVQMDIAMGFKARPMKDSRKSFVAHALVIVCLLTSATSIHVIDGLTTQSVVMALERHSSRYGVPGHIFVDSGTQLEKLQDTTFTLRNIEGWESHGMRFSITVSTPKAHEQQGRVEAKIKNVRKTLQAFSDTCELVNTLLGWETIFARISDFLDNIPIARGSSRAPGDLGWEVITPNRLKIGRNNFRQLEGSIVLAGAPQTMLERNRELSDKWYELFVERIHHLVPQALPNNARDIEIGDVVLFTFLDAGTHRMWEWRLGVVTARVSRSTVEIRYVSTLGSPPRKITRDLRHVSLIHGIDEIPPMSAKFWSN
jgi:hypothetical protein